MAEKVAEDLKLNGTTEQNVLDRETSLNRKSRIEDAVKSEKRQPCLEERRNTRIMRMKNMWAGVRERGENRNEHGENK